MNLTYAVDRLYDTGWTPSSELETESLPDGRRHPSVVAVQHTFIKAGLELALKHNAAFNCYRATWGPAGEQMDDAHPADQRHGTVIGSCQREAAVYALAHLREAQTEKQFATTA